MLHHNLIIWKLKIIFKETKIKVGDSQPMSVQLWYIFIVLNLILKNTDSEFTANVSQVFILSRHFEKMHHSYRLHGWKSESQRFKAHDGKVWPLFVLWIYFWILKVKDSSQTRMMIKDFHVTFEDFIYFSVWKPWYLVIANSIKIYSIIDYRRPTLIFWNHLSYIMI